MFTRNHIGGSGHKKLCMNRTQWKDRKPTPYNTNTDNNSSTYKRQFISCLANPHWFAIPLFYFMSRHNVTWWTDTNSLPMNTPFVRAPTLIHNHTFQKLQKRCRQARGMSTLQGTRDCKTRKDIQQSLRDFFVLCPSFFRSFQFFTLLIFEKVRAALLHISRLREIPSAAMEKLMTFPIKIFSNYYRYGCTLTMSWPAL